MALSHRNGIALSGITALNGIAKATLSAINGQDIGGGGGGSTPTIVQHGVASHATAAVVTLGSSTASGCLLVAFMFYDIGGFTSLVDSKGNSVGSPAHAETTDATSGMACRSYIYAPGTVGASHALTCTALNAALFVVELGSTLTSGFTDQIPAANVDSASPFTSTTTGTTAQANEVILAACGTNGSGTGAHTVGGSFAAGDKLREATNGAFWMGVMAGKVVSSTGTFQSSVTETGAGSTRTLNMIVTIKSA